MNHIPLRPPKVSHAPRDMNVKSSKNADDSSDDEDLKKVISNTRKYMENYNATREIGSHKPYGRNRTRPDLKKNAKPPPHYTCHRCKQKGHYIEDCPTNGNPDFDLKKASKGMPKNLKKENLAEDVQDKFIKTLLNEEISYKNNFKASIMPEFQCLICQDVFTNPGLMPCCGINYCWQCIISKLDYQTNEFECPKCKECVFVDNSTETPAGNVIVNTLLDRLSKMYKRELANQRYIKEVELKSKLSHEIPDFSQEVDGIDADQDFDEERLKEGYKTDDQDYKAIEEILGLDGIEQEDNEDGHGAKADGRDPKGSLAEQRKNFAKPNPAVAMQKMHQTQLSQGGYPMVNPQMMGNPFGKQDNMYGNHRAKDISNVVNLMLSGGMKGITGLTNPAMMASNMGRGKDPKRRGKKRDRKADSMRQRDSRA